jgi:hypothetical protein
VAVSGTDIFPELERNQGLLQETALGIAGAVIQPGRGRDNTPLH